MSNPNSKPWPLGQPLHTPNPSPSSSASSSPEQTHHGDSSGSDKGKSPCYFSERSTGSEKHSSPDELPPPLYCSRPSSTRSSPRKSQPTAILGAIDENGGMAPDIPIRSSRRTGTGNQFIYKPSFLNNLFPSSSTTIVSPPASEYDTVTGPRGEKFNDMRENRALQRKPNILRRGGWRLWACIGLLIIMLIALAAIGLVVGLTRMKHNKSSSSAAANNDTDSVPITSFPVGSYTITPFLLSLASTCTPNAATWRCYPYQTYSASQTGSMTTLNWVISGTNTSGQTSYFISASSNPFALPFNGAKLSLEDRGLDTERWSFETVLEKVVVPDAVITDDGSTARCYYNSSMLMGDLYTKRKLTLGSIGAQGWPHAVSVVQTGEAKPDCWKMVNGVDVERVQVPGEGTGECSCDYADYQDGSG